MKKILVALILAILLASCGGSESTASDYSSAETVTADTEKSHYDLERIRTPNGYADVRRCVDTELGIVLYNWYGSDMVAFKLTAEGLAAYKAGRD